MQSLTDYIIHYKNAVPESLCDLIVETTKASDSWTTAKVRFGEVNEARKCSVTTLSAWPLLDAELFSHITNILAQQCEKFPRLEVSIDTGYDVLRYQPTDMFKEHTDDYGLEPRVISCSVALNDDYEGGEFAFFGGEVIYKLHKGDALVFPSNFMYPHQICPVTEGTRYSIVTWFR